MRPRLSFPKRHRLRRQSEFERVKRSGRLERGALLMLRVLVGESGSRFRAGFIASKKIGGAVLRNRVRRRLRETVRRHQHEIVEGAWVVTVARATAGRATYRELEDEWLRLAKRASILAL